MSELTMYGQLGFGGWWVLAQVVVCAWFVAWWRTRGLRK